MFGKKNREIAHLKEVIQFKESELRAEGTAAIQIKKQLGESLREKAEVQRQLRENKIKLEEKTADVLFLESIVDGYESAAKASAALHRDKLRKIYGVCGKLRQIIRAQNERIALLENNLQAAGVTMGQMSEECLARYQSQIALQSKLEVYERFVGDFEAEKEEVRDDGRVCEQAVPGNAEPADKDGDAAETPNRRDVCGSGNVSALFDAGQPGTAAAGEKDGEK